MNDARYEDAVFSDRPLRIAATDPDDISVISALIQDAVGLAGEVAWLRRRRRVVLLVNRFRWEDHEVAARQGRAFERVRTALVFDDVLAMRSLGLDPADKDTVYALLSLTFEPGEDGTGRVVMTLAGDGELALEVEALDARLIDLTRPWVAQGAPSHDPD
ncbi:MAG: DUF2948 family protein [Pseudomonadota bacterium]